MVRLARSNIFFWDQPFATGGSPRTLAALHNIANREVKKTYTKYLEKEKSKFKENKV